MASPMPALSFFLLIAHLILAMADPSSTYPVPCECEINLRLYLHQVIEEPNVNQESVVPSRHPDTKFGEIAVNDWALLDAPAPDTALVGHTQGTHVQANQANSDGWHVSFSLVFENGRFNGSTFQVMGISATKGQMAIVGGTGEFTMARGVINYQVIKPTKRDSYKQLDIHAFYLQPAAANTTGINFHPVI